ncbi:MAG: FKBP-type peptidyl-prolyl cis-trans isomerase [Marinicaulis sp.]|nr:FKBP-type peptidyl-prolyl cis-trans isomerase [Marinicaulis sp.]
MRNVLKISAGVAALALAACGGSKTDGAEVAENNDAVAGAEQKIEQKSNAERKAEFEKIAAERLAASMKFLNEKSAQEGIAKTESGLLYEVLEEGPEDGISPISTDLVVVHYVGTLKDGVEFDSSRARGAAASFKLNQVIPGWTEGLQLMSEGDRFRFFVPPDLAYGETPRPGGAIGPNDALIFDVELLKVQNPERNLAASTAWLEDNAKKEGVQTTPSGLQYKVLSSGKDDGASPAATDTVKVHYAGTLTNGTKFDSSYDRGEPIEFPLNRVIAGWTEGVQLMNEGDKYQFFIPPDLGYGESGTPGGPIGPNEALVFEVELIEVK